MKGENLTDKLPELSVHYRKSSVIPKLLIGILGVVIAIYSFNMGTTKGTIMAIGILIIIGINVFRSIEVVSEEKPILKLTEEGIDIKELGFYKWSSIKSAKIRGPIGSSLVQNLDLKIKNNKELIKQTVRIDELEMTGQNLLNKIEEYSSKKK